jgi:Uma2 family endonuclease
MVAMAYDTVPVRAEGFTVEDLAEMPDDGRRYELVDGVLVVSPAPRPRHQLAAYRLGEILTRASPPDLVVIPSSLDLDLGLKLRVYARLGVPHYWVLHPREHWIRVHELRAGALQRVALAAGTEVCALEQPFAVRFRPSDLLAPFEEAP